MARGKTSDRIVNTGTQTDEGKKRRMTSYGDEELAQAIIVKLSALIRPLSTRPKFRKSLSVVVAMIAELQSVTNDRTSDNGQD